MFGWRRVPVCMPYGSYASGGLSVVCIQSTFHLTEYTKELAVTIQVKSQKCRMHVWDEREHGLVCMPSYDTTVATQLEVAARLSVVSLRWHWGPETLGTGMHSRHMVATQVAASQVSMFSINISSCLVLYYFPARNSLSQFEPETVTNLTPPLNGVLRSTRVTTQYTTRPQSDRMYVWGPWNWQWKRVRMSYGMWHWWSDGPSHPRDFMYYLKGALTWIYRMSLGLWTGWLNRLDTKVNTFVFNKLPVTVNRSA
jgi:hypothetical protein